MEKEGTLYIVATPIGNMEDMTFRAVRILKEAAYVLCEDTRVTGKLFARYEIKTALKRYDAHSSAALQERVIADLADGKEIALVSDAGTPGISDPGVHLVAQIYARGVPAHVASVPGPSSVTAAFSIAGLTGNQFTFLGFAPQKKGRETFFKTLPSEMMPVIFLESTHRIMKTLSALKEYQPTALVVIAREMTKMHEEVVRGNAEGLLSYFEERADHQKGEFVVIVSKA